MAFRFRALQFRLDAKSAALSSMTASAGPLRQPGLATCHHIGETPLMHSPQAAGFFIPLIASMMLLKTPAAVTSAPAPGPWTTSGRGVYHSVSNAAMLSANCVDAKGWSFG